MKKAYGRNEEPKFYSKPNRKWDLFQGSTWRRHKLARPGIFFVLWSDMRSPDAFACALWPFVVETAEMSQLKPLTTPDCPLHKHHEHILIDPIGQ